MRLSKFLKKHNCKWLAKVTGPFIALFVVWLCNGLWHGANILFILYGMYYFMLMIIEILLEKEINMNSALKAGEVTKLKNLLDYEKGSITNLDLIGQDNLKFMIMAFDEGCYLSEHRAPGEAIVFALEGKGIINYEGTDYEVNEGDNFKFDKNALHSVKAVGRFKMALLLVK